MPKFADKIQYYDSTGTLQIIDKPYKLYRRRFTFDITPAVAGWGSSSDSYLYFEFLCTDSQQYYVESMGFNNYITMLSTIFQLTQIPLTGFVHTTGTYPATSPPKGNYIGAYLEISGTWKGVRLLSCGETYSLTPQTKDIYGANRITGFKGTETITLVR